ncbi:MAG: fumarylacetoacetate hydrolase family protein [Usitatibacter sp.]
MKAHYDPAPAADLLANAWRSGEQLTDLPADVRPVSLAQGYDLQDAFIKRMGGGRGWKLGVGSKAAMRAAKIERPLVGRVLESHLHRSGDTVVMPNAAPVTVEFEIAFVLGRDIAPTDKLDPMSAVERKHVTFELVLSRFVNRRAVGWPSFVGDSVGFEALVIGEPITDMEGVARTVVIQADGQEVARGLTGDDLTDPVVSFGYLIEHARERGVTLQRGQIATLGAIGKPFDLPQGAEVVARYLDAEIRVTIRQP